MACQDLALLGRCVIRQTKSSNSGTLRPAQQRYEQPGANYILMHIDRDLELDFIREFAVGGELRTSISADDRRGRIRVAIYAHKLAHMLFRGPDDLRGGVRKLFWAPHRNPPCRQARTEFRARD
jgi:hypothetical protein